jgi:hypothetical protein
MGSVGSCFDNVAAEAFFSTLEHEVLSRHLFTTKAHARQVVVAWCQDFYNTRRRHTSAALMSPIQYETLAADQPAAQLNESLHDSRESPRRPAVKYPATVTGRWSPTWCWQWACYRSSEDKPSTPVSCNRSSTH